MKAGYLSQYFEAVAAKTLSAVEADTVRSNQHEINGTKPLQKIFSTVTGTEKKIFPAKFVYLTDTDDEPVVDDGEGCFLTWYDARAKSAGRTNRSEFRLYFPTTVVSLCAAEGDLLILGKLPSGRVLVLIAEKNSTIASQLLWLFGLDHLKSDGFSIRGELEAENNRIGFAERIVLEHIGIEVIEHQADDFVGEMLSRFGKTFPRTSTFSEYARSTLPDVLPSDDPDAALMAWMEREELLFRAFEREIVAGRLQQGFAGDVDGFLQFSLSVQNRRKSRAGFALEHHLASIFTACHIRYSRTEVTENNSKPDFLFPSISEYRSDIFPVKRLSMLGAKTSCKDRWRQVLTEAQRIEHKHLLTLEAAISEAQTHEMQTSRLQLVLPKPLHTTYTPLQQKWLMSLRDFIGLARIRQESR